MSSEATRCPTYSTSEQVRTIVRSLSVPTSMTACSIFVTRSRKPMKAELHSRRTCAVRLGSVRMTSPTRLQIHRRRRQQAVELKHIGGQSGKSIGKRGHQGKLAPLPCLRCFPARGAGGTGGDGGLFLPATSSGTDSTLPFDKYIIPTHQLAYRQYLPML